MRSLQLLTPLCLLLPVYSSSFADFVNKFSMPAIRKFCISLVVTLPTLHDAQLLDLAEAAKLFTEWALFFKYKLIISVLIYSTD